MTPPPSTAPHPRILVLTQVLPYPLDAGPKVRAYHVLRHLAARAEVTLVSFTRPDDPPEAVAHLRALCAAVHAVPMRRSRLADAGHALAALATGTSFIIRRDASAAMTALLADLTAGGAFHAVHADQLWMARFARDLPVPFKVLDDHNAVFRIVERLAVHEPSALRRAFLRREAGRIARYEAAQAAAFDRMLFVSAPDREAVRSVADEAARAALDARSAVLPICVDVSEVTPVDVRPDARRLTVLGTMFWPPNAEGVLWFAERVLPAVLAAHPDACLTIIGKRPPRAVEALAARFGPAAVEVRGYVADLRPLLEETAVFLVPLLSGGGMRVKILDAWAWGLPVVSTTVGAEGIDLREGEDILLADAPEEMAAAVLGLLGDPPRRGALGAHGRRAVEARYDAAAVYAALDAIYAPVLGAAAPEPEHDA